MTHETSQPLRSFVLLHAWHEINIIEISDCRIAAGRVRLLSLLRSKPEVLNSTTATALIICQTVLLAYHLHRRLVNFWVFCSSWSSSFFRYEVTFVGGAGTTATTATVVGWWLIFVCLIPAIIRSIVVKKCTSSHVSRKSVTSFYLFQILFFPFNRILIWQLTMRNRRHFGHKWMRSFLVFIRVSVEKLVAHNLLLNLPVLSSLLRRNTMQL